MEEYITIIVKCNNDYKKILQFLTSLIDYKFKFWYLFKVGDLRLRVLKSDKDKIIERLNMNFFNYIIDIYEPEIYLFGGEKNINNIHRIFVEITKIFLTKIYNINNSLEVKISLLNYYIKLYKLDYFEEWDVWRKINENRKLDKNIRREIILNNLDSIYRVIQNYKFYIKEIEFEELTKIVNKMKSNRDKLYNTGYRSTIANTVIFLMNIISLETKEQLAVINLIEFIKNPDFRRDFGDDIC